MVFHQLLKISKALSFIPFPAWEWFLHQEPEWNEMQPIHQSYPDGIFLCLMTVCGLNDYQLKGKADKVYWPLIRRHIENYPVPASTEDLQCVLAQFFARE